MTEFISYIVKASASLVVVYMVYYLLLRRLTFYNCNRWYLVCFSLLSFAFPLINVANIIALFSQEKKEAILQIPSIYNLSVLGNEAVSQRFEWNTANIMLCVLATGTLVFAVRLIVQFISLQKMRRAAKLVVEGPVKVYQVNDKILPFSFANAIFINSETHSEEELREIIRHEYVHVKEKHSIDILIGEILCLFNWFNPFAWLIRNAIRQNLEFIADEKVLQQGFDKTQYQYLLLRVIGVPQFSITNNFNFTSLKKRIIMMNKNRSARANVARFLVILPIVLVLLVAFRKVQDSNVQQDTAVIINDTIPSKRGSVDPEQVVNVDIRKNNKEKTVTIRLKDGTVEKYNLNDKKQKEEFESKYGELATPPPPPAAPDAPPAPNAPPAPIIERVDIPAPKSKPAPAPHVEKVAIPPTPPTPPVPPAKKKGDKSVTIVREITETSGSEKTTHMELKADTIVIMDISHDADGNRVSSTVGDASQALIFIDGKEQPAGTSLKKMVKPDDIESIAVFKGDKATAEYGDKAKHGVIKVETKKKKAINL